MKPWICIALVLLFTACNTANPQIISLMKVMINNPSAGQPIENFKRSDEGYNFEYTGTQLGGTVLMVWHSPSKWWMQILDASIKPGDLGCSGNGRCKTSLGEVHVQTTGTEVNVRSIPFAQEFTPGLL